MVWMKKLAPPEGEAAAARRRLEMGLGMKGELLASDMNGRGDWIRTSDPHTPSVMRYQAALRPDRVASPRFGQAALGI